MSIAEAIDQEKGKQSFSFDSTEQEVFLNLWRTYDRLRQFEDELFGQHDLTAQQYNLLRLLRADHPELQPTLSLANRLVSRAPDITRMLDKLEQRGLIARAKQAGDRRTVLIGITRPGIDLLTQLAEPLQECHRRQLGHLSETNLRKLARLLHDARQPHEAEDSPWK